MEVTVSILELSQPSRRNLARIPVEGAAAGLVEQRLVEGVRAGDVRPFQADDVRRVAVGVVDLENIALLLHDLVALHVEEARIDVRDLVDVHVAYEDVPALPRFKLDWFRLLVLVVLLARRQVIAQGRGVDLHAVERRAEVQDEGAIVGMDVIVICLLFHALGHEEFSVVEPLLDERLGQFPGSPVVVPVHAVVRQDQDLVLLASLLQCRGMLPGIPASGVVAVQGDDPGDALALVGLYQLGRVVDARQAGRGLDVDVSQGDGVEAPLDQEAAVAIL
jgi:hypothetical protein